jgi:NitT/TauT family transport system ATP-binding protein
MAKIDCVNLSRVFQIGSQSVTAIRDLNFTVAAGELVSVVGKTGCGKSTALAILLGLDRPTSGKLTIDGKEPYGDFVYFRGKLSVVFQTDRLLPWRTALDNATYGLEILGVPKAQRVKRAAEWLEKVALAGFERAYPHELSGGMRQRVGIARAFSVEPELILCDEAFGHLDEVTATKLRSDFLALIRDSGKTALFVTHDIDEAIELGGRILVLGKPARLLLDLEVTRDVKEAPEARKETRRRIIQAIENDQPSL